ncbi:hypothetical protein VOLCADRAFT_102898 [Volvox carteri f. nagariensis]|uniref:Uncharacterized protein n=1 Tax=Volvox carteri f. nagariensis TaxID=3068 RepID=D8TIS2_VOLCA|nr:uncharacterized protein VOLCADRAFT_102898 [Volvox carteri f. nagariensis]EFJ53294.1 hypothetical protein VOLCADRAFT_102898 [Volvox carteri f. nagariensis]|eukprot:XP_002946299.1 hypothetical protein VOLCADRAFT_102898 [Volvox carteri f. nagariensis]
MALTNVRYPVYEPTSDCVLFVKGYAVCSLDSNNVMDLVAGNIYTQQETVCSGDGYRGEARFSAITALAPDGKGSVYIAEAERMRKVDLLSGQNDEHFRRPAIHFEIRQKSQTEIIY